MASAVVTLLLLCDTARTIDWTAGGMLLPSVSSCCDRLAPELLLAAPSNAAAAFGEAATWLKLPYICSIFCSTGSSWPGRSGVPTKSCSQRKCSSTRCAGSTAGAVEVNTVPSIAPMRRWRMVVWRAISFIASGPSVFPAASSSRPPWVSRLSSVSASKAWNTLRNGEFGPDSVLSSSRPSLMDPNGLICRSPMAVSQRRT